MDIEQKKIISYQESCSRKIVHDSLPSQPSHLPVFDKPVMPPLYHHPQHATPHNPQIHMSACADDCPLGECSNTIRPLDATPICGIVGQRLPGRGAIGHC